VLRYPVRLIHITTFNTIKWKSHRWGSDIVGINVPCREYLFTGTYIKVKKVRQNEKQNRHKQINSEKK